MKRTENLPDVKAMACPCPILFFFIGLGMMPLPVFAQSNNFAPATTPPSLEEPVKFFSVGTLEEQPKLLPDSPKLQVPPLIQQLEAVVAKDPKNLEANFDLLMAYSRSSLLEKAWPIALKIDRLSPAYTLKVLDQTAQQIKADPKDLEARYRNAMASFARGLQVKEKARTLYMESLKKRATYPKDWWDDFKDYLQSGDEKFANDLNNAQVVRSLDEVRARRQEAQQQLEAILQQDSKEVWAKNYLAFLSFDQGNMAKAEKLIQESLTLDNQNPISHFALGQLYLKQGKLEEFVQQMKTAFKLRAEGK
jgi:thioredoxin-like negative regulator of GroEL